MSFDNLCKLLSEKYPDQFATWLLGERPSSIEVLKTELSIEPIRADSVIFLQTQDRILHLEFQVKLDSDPPIPMRMLDYWIRLHRLYRLPITQVVVLLLPPSADTVIETAFELETTRHEYQVLKLWEQDSNFFLNNAVLLPFAPLTSPASSESLLRQSAAQVSQIESMQQRREVSAYTQLMAGLKFKKAMIRRVFQEGMMRESVIYQEIHEDGEQKGRQEEGVSLILRQLTRKVGEIDPAIRSRIESLPLPLLEDLGEALLDFTSATDLGAWFEAQLSE